MKGTFVVLAACAVFLSACGGSDGGGGEEEITFATIHSEIIGRACNGPMCHLTAAGGNMVLVPAPAGYDAIIDQPASGPECANSGLTRVVPGDPDMSLFYLKLFASPPCGLQMPVAGLLAESEVEMIREWIEIGAPE